MVQPRYDLTGPELYIKFAKDYIKETGNLDILHFSGCGDSEKYSLYHIGGISVLEPSPPADDVPSWVPDWRVQSRPLVLLSDPGYDVRSHFTATMIMPQLHGQEFCWIPNTIPLDRPYTYLCSSLRHKDQHLDRTYRTITR
ncbi:hypothetical protein ACJA88_015233 [Fusarium oxysporum]